MGSRIFRSIKTQFNFVNYDYIYNHTCRVVGFFCSYLFGLLSRPFFRNEESRNLYEYESNSDAILHKQDDDHTEKQSIISSRYEYWPGKDIPRFMEEPAALCFTVQESNLDLDFSDPVLDLQKVGLLAEETEEFFESNIADDELLSEEPEFIDEIVSDIENCVSDNEFETEQTEDYVNSVVVDEGFEKPEMEEIYDLNHEYELPNEVKLIKECDEEEESFCLNDVFVDDKLNSISEEVSGIAFVDPETLVFENEPNFIEEIISERENSDDGITGKDSGNHEFETEKTEDSVEKVEMKKIYDINHEENKDTRESFDEQFSEILENKSDFEVQKETDYLAEHEDLIQQLKLELKLARTGGLPTILEESESEELETPKSVAQHLKPMKIDDPTLDYNHLLEEIQKVHTNYSHKMRKLDILNFQTMHALGLLEIKGAVDVQRARKSASVPAIMSLLSHNLWLCKGSAVIEPMKRVIADMDRDLESVYIGQLCLSWEILHWQYWKAQELMNYASKDSHCFNQVASEFQLFQVLVQRFLENEQFQGPRTRNYVNNRCILRSLLQVPLLRDDNVKDRGKSNEDAVTIQMLPVIIEQSMKVFWDFVRADKDQTNALFPSHIQPQSNLGKLVDFELLTNVRTEFQKKEKKLKDVLRSGNCIVKRFKKQREEEDRGMLIAQVEMKLIAKVLYMSNLTTEKLIWCHEKLEKINVCNRRVNVEASFLLFPC